MKLFLHDDAHARAFEPFALTRPAGELRLGGWTQTQRAEQLTGLSCSGHLGADELAGFEEPGAAPVVDAAETARATEDVGDAGALVLSSRVVLDWSARAELARALESRRACTLHVDGAVAGVLAPDAGRFRRLLERLDAPAEWPDVVDAGRLELRGYWLRHTWDLVAASPDQTARDVEHDAPGAASPLPDGVHRIGEGALVLGRGVRIEPGVVFDTREGPIWLQDDVEVRAFSRVAGPTIVAPRSILLGGSYEAVSLGPVSRVRGEVEETIVLGYSNKAHDGFLGHACLGRWVNLGALTTNSDLKNNYGDVRLTLANGTVDTGLRKVGCFLGDHAKTGIGMMLNTGTVIGAGANLYGSAMPPKRVPAFAWGTGDRLSEYELGRFLETARTVMSRREVTLSDGMSALLERAWRATAGERAAS